MWQGPYWSPGDGVHRQGSSGCGTRPLCVTVASRTIVCGANIYICFSHCHFMKLDFPQLLFSWTEVRVSYTVPERISGHVQGDRRRKEAASPEPAFPEHLPHAKCRGTHFANIWFHLNRYPFRNILSPFYR